MMKLENFVGMMTGHFDNKDQFDKMQEEYDQYVSDKAAEAKGEEATTEAATTTEAETTETTTTVAADDKNTDSDAEETTAAEDSEENASETTTVTTNAPEEETTTETTTTTSPYANEKIIAVVTTDKDTKEEDVTYTPSKTFYDWVYNTAKTGVPEIVKDDDTIYVAVRLDITERMTCLLYTSDAADD